MNSTFFTAHMPHLALIILLLSSPARADLRPSRDFPVSLGAKDSSRAEGDVITKEGGKEEANMELFPTGSSLPDCAHACGPCFPCKRVIVSFKCSISESCPIVYRCMCKGKYYHVPSN